jgi:hypothetical protein
LLNIFNKYVSGQSVSKLDDTQRSVADLLRYIKNYQGILKRKNKTPVNYRFSDEREWRYVPPYESGCNMICNTAYYKLNRTEIDAKVAPLRLKFEPNDIKYIIIKDDADISDFVELLKKAKSKYCYEDVERLTTRILTTEQIRSDI